MGLRWRASIVSALFGIIVIPTLTHAASTSLVIRQVYSSQNPHSRLRNDFIELFNVGSTPVNVSGWTVPQGRVGLGYAF